MPLPSPFCGYLYQVHYQTGSHKSATRSPVMKRAIPICLFWLYCTVAHAQNAEIDSLNRLLRQAKTPTERIDLAVKKIASLNEVNLDSAIVVGKQAIVDAQKIGYRQGEAKARIRLASSYSFKGDFATARDNLQMAERMLAGQNDLTDLGDVYSGYGILYGMQSKYDSSITYFEKVINIGQQTANKKLLSRGYQNIGISYQMQSKHYQALDYFQKGLTLAEARHDINTQAYTLVNMGITYNEMGDDARVEPTLLKAIDLAKQVGIRNVELYAYSNLSSHYETRGDYVKAYQFGMRAATLGEQMGDAGIQAASLAKAASALVQQKKLGEAEALASRAVAIAVSANQPLVIYQTNSVMGTVQKAKGAYSTALTYFEKGFGSLANADIYEAPIGRSYLDASYCYEQTGNYRRALATYKTASQIADSVRSKENVLKTTELRMNYEFAKKRQVAQAEQQKEKALSSTRQLALSAGLLLTLIAAFLAFRAYRTKQRANVLLEKQKAEIESTLAELKATQDQLVQQEKMASLGELTAGIAHEIQNPLNFVNNFAEVSVELCQELTDELPKLTLPEADKTYLGELIGDLAQNQEKIAHHGRRADGIVKSMLQHSRASSGTPEPTDLNALADEYLRLAYHGLRAKDKSFNAQITTDLDPTVGPVKVVAQDIGRVLLNLYTNAFHAVQERQRKQQTSVTAGVADEPTDAYHPQVWVSSRVSAGTVELRVKDNGTGIPASLLNKIYQPFFTTKPTGQGTGLGLSLSYDIVKGHRGTLDVNTQEGEGTEFIIRLPR